MKRTNCFQIKNQSFIFYCSSQSQSDMESWITALNTAKVCNFKLEKTKLKKFIININKIIIFFFFFRMYINIKFKNKIKIKSNKIKTIKKIIVFFFFSKTNH